MQPVCVKSKARSYARKGSPSDSRNSKFLVGWNESKYHPSLSTSVLYSANDRDSLNPIPQNSTQKRFVSCNSSDDKFGRLVFI